LFFHVRSDRIPLGKVERGGVQLSIDPAGLSNQNRAMKTSLLTAVMVAGLATVVLGSSAETEIKALEQQWLDAYVKADTAFLKTVEAEDWMFVDSDGGLNTKAQDIKDVADKTLTCKSASISDVKVRTMGDNSAYATGIVKMAGTYKGKDFSSEFRAVDIYEKKDGKWQAVYSQITRVKKEKE
jgi:ketosteroid isomerase-like protein